MVPYKVKAGPHNDVRFATRAGDFSPQEISARVLMKLKLAAEDYLGDTNGILLIARSLHFGFRFLSICIDSSALFSN